MSDTPPDRRNVVDILCVGAQKSATSWAAHVLNLHPQVWFPREHALKGKELRFFDLHWKKGLDWYRRVSRPPRPDLKSTDVSPGYAVVGEGKVKTCHTLSPDARVFMILREPGARDWSSLMMQAQRRGFDVAGASFVDLMVLYDLTNVRRFTNYVSTIELWRSYYGDQFKVFFYDDVEADPVAFYEDLCAHVGLDPDAVDGWRERIRTVIFKGPDFQPPAQMREFLDRKYADMVARLEELVERDLSHWRSTA